MSQQRMSQGHVACVCEYVGLVRLMHSGNAQKLVHNIVRIGERGYCIYNIITVLMCYKSPSKNGWHLNTNYKYQPV